MKAYVFCLLALLAFVAVPAAQTAKNDADKDAARLKELDEKIKQQQKALAELEAERNRIIQQQQKKRYLKVEIRGKLEFFGYAPMAPTPTVGYCVVVDAQTRLGLELRSQELKDLANKYQGKEVILSGTGYKSSQPRPFINDEGFSPRPPEPPLINTVAVDSLKLAER